MALSFSDAKKIPITEYLSKIGFEPVRVRGNDYWYHSPFRNDHNPSFKVNAKLNVWYDHGSGEGGTLLDLGVKMNSCTLADFVRTLEKDYHGIGFGPTNYTRPDSKLEVLSVGRLVDVDLLRYLDERGIAPNVSREFCNEVLFKISNKEYLAVGFPNRSNGFELRNRWFKGSSSPKDISLVNNSSDHICVMEGFIDFLSMSRLRQCVPEILDRTSDFLILNSLSLLKKNIDILKGYQNVTVFFDNDQAGEVAKTVLTESDVSFTDASSCYKGYKDVNDFIRAMLQHESNQTRSRGFRP